MVLATSRARVGGAREWLVELTGLSLARASDGAPASSPAAQLFAASARRLVPGFSAAAEADAVERICTCVGGLPLALQMAARAVHSAGTAAVADRLGSSTALTDPDRDADDRHHSIELVLEDSWALLDEPTRAAALRLAWLPAEADAGLARAIGVGDAALATLRDHSWLQRSGSARFALHPLQQDFLRRRPLAGSQATEVRSAVARHLREAMPAVPPFGDVRGADAAHAATLAGSAAGAAPVIADAAAQCCAEAKLDALVPWIDSAVALLQHADRQSEAAALLAQALVRADLPRWLSTGWGLRRAELLSAEGAATASLRGYSQALGEFGLGEVAPGGKAWLAMPSAIARLLARRDWPAPGLSRTGFEALLLRSLYFSTIYLTFSPGPMPAARLAALADVLARRLRGHADLRRLMAGWGLATFGHPVLAGLQERRTSPPGRPKGEFRSAQHEGTRISPPDRPEGDYRSAQHEGTPVSAARKPSADLPLEALYTEGQCALRMTLGRWGGLGAAFDDAAARWAALRNVRHEMGMRSLGAKLALYEGRLAEAYDRFAEVSELSLQRPGETWRAWGPMGQAETALCLGRLDDAALQRLYERASQVMTEMEDVDSAYTLRRLGLAARLAWRRGDVNAAREAVLAGCAAAARLTYCSFWSHEGYVGLGDMLLALRRHERERGGASPPLDAGWAQLEPALQAHVRRFPPAAALFERLRGQHALDDGSVAAATSALRRAVGLSERQGMRVELARACQALADIDTKGPWRERAARLSHDLGLQPASRGAGDPVGRASA